MEQLAVIVWANVHIVMAGGKFAKFHIRGWCVHIGCSLGRPDGKLCWYGGKGVTELNKWDMGTIAINWIRG